MTKQEKYQTLLPQIEALVAGEKDMIANMANVAAVLHEAFGFWWTGFYRVEGQQLVLGPFQGPIACTHISFGRGVCGTGLATRRNGHRAQRPRVCRTYSVLFSLQQRNRCSDSARRKSSSSPGHRQHRFQHLRCN